MSRSADAAQNILSSSHAILADVNRLPAELLHWHPAPDVWSVMDILCHIEEFIPYWTAQTLGAVKHPDREWGRDHSDPARRAAVANTPSRSLAEVTKNIRAFAGQSAAAIAELSDADLAVEARSRNPRWGIKTAGFIVEELLVVHLEKHLGQIRRNESQYLKDHITT